MIQTEVDDRPNLQIKRRHNDLCDQVTSRVRSMAKVMGDGSLTDKDLPDAPMGLPDIVSEKPGDAPNLHQPSRSRKASNKIDPARSVTPAPPPRGGIGGHEGLGGGQMAGSSDGAGVIGATAKQKAKIPGAGALSRNES